MYPVDWESAVIIMVKTMVAPLSQLLNIGCGAVFHSDWVNIDLIAASPEVIRFDLRRGLPFDHQSMTVCYSSHVVEHLSRTAVDGFLAECFRVLKPGGIIRIVVPDLAKIAELYLQAFNQIQAGDLTAVSQYEWMMLELYDQTVREFPGGEMLAYLTHDNLQHQDFIRSRIGQEFDYIRTQIPQLKTRSWWDKCRSKSLAWYLQKIRLTLASWSVSILAGRDAQTAFQLGLFRQSGEIHRWMYDAVSLGQLLQQAGFVDIQVCAADQSRIPNFVDYNLDTCKGEIRKPDSLFMEGIKP